MNIEELNNLLSTIKNPTIGKALLTTYHKLNNCNYKKVLCAISGGSDSDIVLDLLTKCDNNKIVEYFYFDTGLEYQATKEHINYLQEKYGIVITTLKPKTPIPLAVKKFGQPFLSKMVSENIQRLQKHGFNWENKPYEELVKDYPNCKSALQWWSNSRKNNVLLGIIRNKGLKEFMINNNPNFSISNKCCKYAKKDILKDLLKQGYDLNISGIRKSEGGVRSTAYKSCFDSSNNYDNYRPIFWFTDNDKLEYRKLFNVTNSKCYTVYGLKRTGCVGCPFSKNYKEELEIVKKYEPKLYKAVTNLFKDSYEYINKYKGE